MLVFQCTSEIGKQECKTLGGQCTIYQDGYYMVSGISIVISIALLLFFIRGTARRIEGK
jgi:hypothetical protein